ncbi:hypothetical protein ACO0QE_001976 [Hanseniaspora vineae]
MSCALVTGGSRGIGNKVVRELIKSSAWVSAASASPTTIVFLSKNESSVTRAMTDLIAFQGKLGIISDSRKLRLIGVSMDVNAFSANQTPTTVFEWSTGRSEAKKVTYTSWEELFVKAKHQSEASVPFPSVVVQSHGITQEKLTLGYKSPLEILNIVNTNFTSTVLLNNYFVRKWVSQDIKNRRKPDTGTTDKKIIVNVSSILGTQPDLNLPGTAIYSATKSALWKYTEVFKKELQKYQNWLTIACYSPCLVTDTDMVKNLHKNKTQPADVSPRDYMKNLLISKSDGAGIVSGGGASQRDEHTHNTTKCKEHVAPVELESKTSDQVAKEIVNLIETAYGR